MIDPDRDGYGGWQYGRTQLTFDVLVLCRSNWPKRPPLEVSSQIALNHFGKTFGALTFDELRAIRNDLENLRTWDVDPPADPAKDQRERAVERQIAADIVARDGRRPTRSVCSCPSCATKAEVVRGCSVCAGIGKVIAFGMDGKIYAIECEECAGGSWVPASAEDVLLEPEEGKVA